MAGGERQIPDVVIQFEQRAAAAKIQTIHATAIF